MENPSSHREKGGPGYTYTIHIGKRISLMYFFTYC
jgi:hypothetical protein